MKEPAAILVVSHDPHHADVRKHRLEDAGYEVIPAMNIQAVREACEKRTLQLARNARDQWNGAPNNRWANLLPRLRLDTENCLNALGLVLASTSCLICLL
jgi:hypothetical protein